MKCNECGTDMIITNSKFVSDVDTTDVKCEMTLVCRNETCSMYGGTDLNSPTRSEKVLKDVN